MIFFYVIHHKAPGEYLYIESTISGFCIFSKFESRAKLFTESEADELVRHLHSRKIKNHYAKIKATIATNDDAKFRFTTPSHEISDHGSDPERKEDRSENKFHLPDETI